MRRLPESGEALVLRTDFSNQAVWEAIRAAIREPVGDEGFLANVRFIDDLEYRDLSTAQLLELLRGSRAHTYVIVADRTTMTHPDHPLLVVDLHTEPGREFRAVPTQIQAIENNLSLANMDFREFADSVDESGVFRGFPEY